MNNSRLELEKFVRECPRGDPWRPGSIKEVIERAEKAARRFKKMFQDPDKGSKR